MDSYNCFHTKFLESSKRTSIINQHIQGCPSCLEKVGELDYNEKRIQNYLKKFDLQEELEHSLQSEIASLLVEVENKQRSRGASRKQSQAFLREMLSLKSLLLISFGVLSFFILKTWS